MRGASRLMSLMVGIPGRLRAPAEPDCGVARCRPAYRLLVIGLMVCLLGCSRLDTQGEPQTVKSSRASLSYIGAWGMKGSEPGQLDQPTSIAADRIGDSYVPDAGSQFIHKFDAHGTPLLAFQDAQLTHPQSIAVDRGGAIYVTDPARGSVFVFFPNGDRYRELRLPTRSNAENMLSVAVDDDGIIHVLDTNAGKIFSYTPRFKLVHTWQPFGISPQSPAHEGAIASGSDGYLYLADPSGNRVIRISGDGHASLEIRAASSGADRKLSAELAVANKYIFVMDADGRMLHVWTNDGKPVLDDDLAPELGQGTRYPPALAVSSHGELLVLDDRESRVLRYKIDF
jgi:DNA-binding beta-propeller fold protein YncE